MRGLTIVVAEPGAARLRTALLMALAQAALGGGARVFLNGAAVAAVRAPIVAADDPAHLAAGQPSLADLIDEALDAGVAITLCQTGLQLAGADPGAFDRRFAFGGIVGLIATLEDDRLVAL